MADVREIAYVAVGDNHERHVAQIVSSPEWRVATGLVTLGEALRGFTSGKYAGIIIEDTQHCPAALHVFQELRNPALYLAPTMVLVDKDRIDDETAFASQFGFVTTTKPITRMMMIQAFSSLIKRIQSPSSAAAHACAMALASGVPAEQDRAIANIRLLAKDALFVHRAACACALARLSVSAADVPGALKIDAFRAAEGELLKHAKSHSGNIMAFLILANLYMELSMTVLARRLMQSASSAAARFSLPQVFLAQLHLLLGEMEDAIVVLTQLMRLNYMAEQTSFSLAKLYCSVGRLDQADKLLVKQVGRFNALKAAWMEAK